MTLKTYIVTWEIELDAESPRAAAEEALEIQRDPISEANVFLVSDPSQHETHLIDLGGFLDDHQFHSLRCPYCGSSSTEHEGYRHECHTCGMAFWV